jgi:hypothetical protein
MAQRYLGRASATTSTTRGATTSTATRSVQMRPERWLTLDYNKLFG